MAKTLPFWFIRDGAKLIQCSKDDFDKAIVEGKSVRYRGYANKKCERTAERLEESTSGISGKTRHAHEVSRGINLPQKRC